MNSEEFISLQAEIQGNTESSQTQDVGRGYVSIRERDKNEKSFMPKVE